MFSKAIFLCISVWMGIGTAQAESTHGDSLTLAATLDSVFAAHPGLEAGRKTIAAREARLAQAARGMNPELALEVEDVAGTGRSKGVSTAQTTLLISQTLELGGKRSRREGLARAEKSLAENALAGKRLEIHALTCGQFMDALHAQRRLVLALEAKALSERLLQAVSRRVSEGAASAADEIRARIAVAEAGLEARQDTLRLESAKRELALLWGREKPLPPLRDGADSLPDLLPLDQIILRTASGPLAANQTLNIRLAEARLNQQQGLYKPDLTFSAGIRHMADPGEAALVGGISMPLPIRDRGQGGREEARQEMEQAKAEERESMLALKARAGEIHQRLALARNEIRSLRESLIPDATKAAAVLEEGYRRGRFGMLEVLAAENDLFRFRLRFLESLSQYHTGHAEMERLIGPDAFDAIHGQGDRK